MSTPGFQEVIKVTAVALSHQPLNCPTDTSNGTGVLQVRYAGIKNRVTKLIVAKICTTDRMIVKRETLSPSTREPERLYVTICISSWTTTRNVSNLYIGSFTGRILLPYLEKKVNPVGTFLKRGSRWPVGAVRKHCWIINKFAIFFRLWYKTSYGIRIKRTNRQPGTVHREKRRTVLFP